MIGELGNFCLVLALCLSIFQSIIPMAGTLKNRPSWMPDVSTIRRLGWT